MTIANSVALATERIVEPVEGMHRAISGRWFSALGPLAKPVRQAHDAIAATVYGAIRLGGVVAGIGVDAAGVVSADAADRTRAVLNGLWGDELGTHSDRLALPMRVRRRNGQPVMPGPELVETFPRPTGRLVILVHGLMETERSWIGADGHDGLFDVLEAHPDLTPVMVRYNTGRPVGSNGADLASILDALHERWPVPIESIALVGNSMGGLVARSACIAAAEADQRWITTLRHVVTLGTPHRGTPLEKLATRPLARFVNRRSRGIKDLRFGTVTEDDSNALDPSALVQLDVGTHPIPDGVNHWFVAGVFTQDPSHPIGEALGDLLVRPASAIGRDRLAPTEAAVRGGLSHFELHRDPDIIDAIASRVADR